MSNANDECFETSTGNFLSSEQRNSLTLSSTRITLKLIYKNGLRLCNLQFAFPVQSASLFHTFIWLVYLFVWFIWFISRAEECKKSGLKSVKSVKRV